MWVFFMYHSSITILRKDKRHQWQDNSLLPGSLSSVWQPVRLMAQQALQGAYWRNACLSILNIVYTKHTSIVKRELSTTSYDYLIRIMLLLLLCIYRSISLNIKLYMSACFCNQRVLFWKLTHFLNLWDYTGIRYFILSFGHVIVCYYRLIGE